MPRLPLDQVLVILIMIGLVVVWWVGEDRPRLHVTLGGARAEGKRGGRRPLRVRSPQDCACCRAAAGQAGVVEGGRVPAWAEGKGRGGRPKRAVSEGLACPNPGCAYYGVREAGVHALVRDGRRGTRRDIAYWRCQACGKRFSGRHASGLFQLKTDPDEVERVMTALGEGVDIAAASRIFGHHPRTILGWLKRGAAQGQRLQTQLFKHLRPGHIQVDELVTKVRSQVERVWLWTAIDAQTKLLLAVHLGRRTQQDAHALIHQLVLRLAVGWLPVFTSDGLNLYFYALTAHFGQWLRQDADGQPVWQVAAGLLYAQFRKIRSGYRLKATQTRVLLGTRAAFSQALDTLHFSGRIQTAFVERLNLTLRELMAPLRRRTWSLAHDEASLAPYVHWGCTYYNFARYHQALVLHTAAGRTRSQTPAMAAGLLSRRYTVGAILALPLPA